MSDCRLCREPLDGAPRIRIEPAPSGAQHFTKTANEALRRAIVLEIAECTACGLVQSASAPVDGFRRAITAAGISAPMREHRIDQARRLAGEMLGGGRRLALVGCGNGYELPLLVESGFQPEGVEFGGAPEGYRGAWPIHDAYPERSHDLPGAPFDAFACYNFLEHAPDPIGFLEGIARSLEENGVGVIEVPNYEQQRRERRAADYVADHLSYFDQPTFWAALTRAGFDVLAMRVVRDGENIEAIVRAGGDAEPVMQPRGESAIARDGELLASARRALGEFFSSWQSRGAPAIVWGASHQALTLLAGLKSGARPRHIVDGAQFKQGLFAPASALPIVAPSAEAVDDAGAVLIIAAGYEREIEKTLREKLGFRGETWTVRGCEVGRLD